MTWEDARQIIATWLVSSKGAKGQCGYIEGWFDEEDAEAFRMAIEALQAEVRCKDCKNWRESNSEDEESYCYIDGRTTDSTDYCSWGERREP